MDGSFRKGWAIWGAGAKSVALANRLRDMQPTFVVDTNPAKQGCIIPATRIPIIAPEDPRVVKAGVVNGSFFEVMGLRPVLGRLLNTADDGPAAAGVVVLTLTLGIGINASVFTVVDRLALKAHGLEERV